jgi:pimeloyl-ACP methyl ester carboxylesterase
VFRDCPKQQGCRANQDSTLRDKQLKPRDFLFTSPTVAGWLPGVRDSVRGASPPLRLNFVNVRLSPRPAFRRRTHESQESPPYDRRVQIAWGSHSVEVRELGSGPVVVLVHGYPLDGAMWSGVARLLSDSFRVLKLDLPGRGATPSAERPGIDAYADFVEAVIRQAGEPVGLAGFSMGGYVALALMKRHLSEIRALALVDTRASADDDAGKAKRDEAIAKVAAEGVAPIADAMLGKLLAPSSASKADLVERVRRVILRQRPEPVAADLAAMRDRPDSSDSLREITVPTLVLVGDQDVLTPPADAQAMVEAIPGARLVTVPEAGHLTPVEQPKAVAKALSEFFGSTLPGR